jgi:hypothetical protein
MSNEKKPDNKQEPPCEEFVQFETAMRKIVSVDGWELRQTEAVRRLRGYGWSQERGCPELTPGASTSSDAAVGGGKFRVAWMTIWDVVCASS